MSSKYICNRSVIKLIKHVNSRNIFNILQKLKLKLNHSEILNTEITFLCVSTGEVLKISHLSYAQGAVFITSYNLQDPYSSVGNIMAVIAPR